MYDNNQNYVSIWLDFEKIQNMIKSQKTYKFTQKSQKTCKKIHRQLYPSRVMVNVSLYVQKFFDLIL